MCIWIHTYIYFKLKFWSSFPTQPNRTCLPEVHRTLPQHWVPSGKFNSWHLSHREPVKWKATDLWISLLLLNLWVFCLWIIIYFIWFLSFSSTLGICFSLPEHVMVSPLMRTHILSCWSLQTLSIPGTQSNTPSSNPPQVHWGCVSIESPAKWTPMGSQPCPYSVLHVSSASALRVLPRASRLHTICHPLLWSHSYSVFSVNLWLIIRSAFHKPTSMHVHVHTHTSITCKTLL